MKEIKNLISEYNFGNNNEKLNVEVYIFEQLICNEKFNYEYAQLLVLLWKNEIEKKSPKYEIITRCVFKNNEKLDLELLDINMNLIAVQIENEQYLDKTEIKGYCDKIIRHIKLAEIQKEYIQNNITKLDEDIEIAKKEVENIKDTKNKIYTEFVAILGIFASIIFGVFGGFQEIQLIGQNLNSTPIPKLLIFASLVMLGITVIVFLCFNAISKLTSLPLKSCNCNVSECNCTFKQKHPTIFWSCGLFLYTLFIGFALRLYKYDDFKFNNLYDGIGEGYDILPIILIVAIPILIIFYSLKIWPFKNLK